MIISYFGDRCFRVESGNTAFLVDPNNNRLKSGLVVRTTMNPRNPILDQSEICFPGDYEIGGIEVEGWEMIDQSDERLVKTIYLVNLEDIHLIFLGAISSMPPPQIMDLWNKVDVIFIPIGGADGLTVDVALKLVKQIEPPYIIPYGGKEVKEFVKKTGKESPNVDKLVFKKKDIGQEQGHVVVLSSK